MVNYKKLQEFSKGLIPSRCYRAACQHQHGRPIRRTIVQSPPLVQQELKHLQASMTTRPMQRTATVTTTQLLTFLQVLGEW